MKAKNGNSRPQVASKWVASINDQGVPMSDRVVSETILRVQAGIPADHVLVADCNDPNDPVIPAGQSVDLAKYSVFYSVPSCDVNQREGDCEGIPKIALTVNDKLKVVIRPAQTGRSISEYFDLSSDVDLFRDNESPQDQVIGSDDEVDLREQSGLRWKFSAQACFT
jgi:hypothetical protein